MDHTLVVLWVVSSLFLGVPEAAPVETRRLLGEICDNARALQSKTQALLETYLSNQGIPFNGSDFSAEHLQLVDLPKASIPYLAWRNLSDTQRLLGNYRAYSIFQEYFQLVQDDQQELNPDRPALLHLLGDVRHDLAHLLEQLSAALEAYGLTRPQPAEDPLSSLDTQTSSFQKRVRGFLVCRQYRMWLFRTQRSFSLMRSRSS
ncbi:cardiotrophin-2-like [Mustelus asterias]